MPRTYLIFGDIEGKLDVLRVECTKCDRLSRPQADREARAQGQHDEREMLNADCPKREAA